MAPMSESSATLIRDPAELQRRLDEMTLDLRNLDLAGFRDWLDRQMGRWSTDPVFAQRARIRDLRRTHPEVRRMDTECRRAMEIVAASPAGRRMAVLDKRLHKAERAIAGLDAALKAPPPNKQSALAEKRASFVAEREWITDEQSALVESSPAHQQLIRVTKEVRRIWEAIGLDREHARLTELLTKTGRESGHAGAKFEE